jgi:hypothetical protein
MVLLGELENDEGEKNFIEKRFRHVSDFWKF